MKTKQLGRTVEEILNNDFYPGIKNEQERNFRTFRALLISSKRKREGRWDIDHCEVTDLAWDMAEQLPDDVVIMKNPDANEEQLPPQTLNWIDTLALIGAVFSTAFFVYIVINVISHL